MDKLSPAMAFTLRQADLVPIVLAVPETYTPTDYLDQPDDDNDITASSDAEMWADERP